MKSKKYQFQKKTKNKKYIKENYQCNCFALIDVLILFQTLFPLHQALHKKLIDKLIKANKKL